jgi:hypothetical protein
MKLYQIKEVNAISTKWQQCVKLSDEEGKHTGDRDEIKICKKTLKII